MRDKVRKHFYFSGDVQMVGFRYQAKYAADDLGLTGWCATFVTEGSRWKYRDGILI